MVKRNCKRRFLTTIPEVIPGGFSTVLGKNVGAMEISLSRGSLK